MKILWVCNLILPEVAKILLRASSNSGGWLVGLSNDLKKMNDVELIVTFPLLDINLIINKQCQDIKYYGFPQNKDTIKYNLKTEVYLANIMSEVKPDVIHIFGTEYPHTLSMVNVCERLGIIDKVIINIQGLISVIAKHYYASIPEKIVNMYTFRDFIKQDNIVQQRNKFIKRGKFELEALQKVKHVIGRTSWDKACTSQINPNAQYHFCNETLRDAFYNKKWDINTCQRHSIFLSQCSYPIKGFHIILEAMPEILKKFPNAHIYTTGANPLKFNSFIDKLKTTYYQKYIGKLIIKLKLQEHVTFLGSLNEEQMCERFVKSHVFVSASSIENSPNSVGEAMLLGVPTISSDVGGVKDMITHNVEGFIYQHDAPYMLAHHVCEIFENDELALDFSEEARKHASITHNREINLNKITEIYNTVIGGK